MKNNIKCCFFYKILTTQKRYRTE